MAPEKLRPQVVKTHLNSCVPQVAKKEHRESVGSLSFDEWEQIPLIDAIKSTRQREFFGPSCKMIYPRGQSPSLAELEIYRIGAQKSIDDVVVCHAGSTLTGMIGFGRSRSRLFFSTDSSCRVDMRVWRNATAFIGPHATINNARIVLDDSQVYIGADAMLSDEILIQAGDQHSIWNLKDNTVSNVEQQCIVLGEHSWIGRRATLLAGTRVGCGSIVGTASVVTGTVENFAVAVGVPARVVRKDVTWSRNIEWFSPREREFLTRRRPSTSQLKIGSPE